VRRSPLSKCATLALKVRPQWGRKNACRGECRRGWASSVRESLHRHTQRSENLTNSIDKSVKERTESWEIGSLGAWEIEKCNDTKSDIQTSQFLVRAISVWLPPNAHCYTFAVDLCRIPSELFSPMLGTPSCTHPLLPTTPTNPTPTPCQLRFDFCQNLVFRNLPMGCQQRIVERIPHKPLYHSIGG